MAKLSIRVEHGDGMGEGYGAGRHDPEAAEHAAGDGVRRETANPGGGRRNRCHAVGGQGANQLHEKERIATRHLSARSPERRVSSAAEELLD